MNFGFEEGLPGGVLFPSAMHGEEELFVSRALNSTGSTESSYPVSGPESKASLRREAIPCGGGAVTPLEHRLFADYPKALRSIRRRIPVLESETGYGTTNSRRILSFGNDDHSSALPGQEQGAATQALVLHREWRSRTFSEVPSKTVMAPLKLGRSNAGSRWPGKRTIGVRRKFAERNGLAAFFREDDIQRLF